MSNEIFTDKEIGILSLNQNVKNVSYVASLFIGT